MFFGIIIATVLSQVVVVDQPRPPTRHTILIVERDVVARLDARSAEELATTCGTGCHRFAVRIVDGAAPTRLFQGARDAAGQSVAGSFDGRVSIGQDGAGHLKRDDGSELAFPLDGSTASVTRLVPDGRGGRVRRVTVVWEDMSRRS